ncbi:MAG TPA: glutaredoxin family protein [Holophagaceae bacterium]|nr:glutaredoxin family protein [Holophagaceae bacterium]
MSGPVRLGRIAMAGPKDLKELDLRIYTAAWCPDCRRLDRWMAERGLAFPKVDIDTEPGAAERLEEETGKRAIPFILVKGTRWVRGYHRELPQRLDGDLLVKELLEAAAS